MKKQDLSWMWHCSSDIKNLVYIPSEYCRKDTKDLVEQGISLGYKLCLGHLTKLDLITTSDINREPNEEDQEIWISKLKNCKPEFTEEELEKTKQFKYLFLNFFEGKYCDGMQAYDKYISIKNFGITNLDFKFKDDVMYIVITLESPGLLIGKAGHTIDSLQKFLNERIGKINIDLEESKLWM